jgi:antitoxin component of MazEF toxin-antitoxin module
MIKRINKVGNSSALILDKALLELVGLREGGEVQLTVRDGSIVVTPTDPERVDAERFEESLDRVMKSRRDVLRRLAE